MEGGADEVVSRCASILRRTVQVCSWNSVWMDVIIVLSFYLYFRLYLGTDDEDGIRLSAGLLFQVV